MWNLKIVAITTTLILLAGSVWYAYDRGLQNGKQDVQAKWDAERAAQMAAMAEAEMKARQVEQSLQHLIQRIRSEGKRDSIKLASDYAAVIHSLHDRAENRAGDGGLPEGSDAGVGPAAGCTGAQLSGPDSRFLAGEAARADQLRIALTTCIAHADAVERELNTSRPASTRP